MVNGRTVAEDMEREHQRQSLRDTFAAAALTGLVSRPQWMPDECVPEAYRLADAMLRERSRTGQKIAQCDSFCAVCPERESTNLDAAPAARGDARECAAPVTAGGTSVGVSATGAESGSTPDAQGLGRSNEYPCQPFDSAPTTDQERFVRFQSAVMNWISEATGFLHDDVLRTDDARDVITNACMRCWDAFDRIAYQTTNHDAVPAAIAPVDRLVRLIATDRESVGTDKAEPLNRDCGTGNTTDRPQPVKDSDFDRSKPIRDARLAALEELSALDQKLELEYGLTGNPLIKAGRCKAAKTDTTPQRNGALSDGPDPESRVCETPCTPPPHATPTQGSVQGEGSFRDSRNAKKPIAWELIEKCSGNVLRRSSNAVLVAGWRRIIGATVVPVFRTRTNVQR